MRGFGLGSPLPSGSKALEGRNASTGKPASQQAETGRTPGSVSGAKPRSGQGGGSRRGGEKPRGRNVIGCGKPGPVVQARRRANAAEWTPWLETTERRYLTTPREAARRESGERREIGKRQESRRETIRRVERQVFERLPAGPTCRSLKVRADAARAADHTRRRRAVAVPDGRNGRRGSPPYESSPNPGHPSRNG